MHALIATVGRNRFGALLIIVQVALTLAIVANATVVVRDQLTRMAQPSGLDEANIFTFINRWVGLGGNAQGRVARDLAVLRATPGVVDAVSTNGVPLSGRGWGTAIDTREIDPLRIALAKRASLYYLDDHGTQALGLQLAAGRWFTPEDIDSAGTPGSQAIVIVSKSLADRLYPDGNALGRPVYFYSPSPSTIVGILRQMKGADAKVDPKWSNDDAVVMPQRMAQNVINNYIVRVRPGAMVATMTEVERRLRAEDPLRVINELRPFDETRANSFRRFRALSVVLGAVSTLLLLVTALGIVGLTSYWVTQRRRAIGVFRALGARRVDIVQQFQLESAVMAGLGTLLGVAATFVLNLWLANHLGIPRLGFREVAVGALLILALAQFAALWPALRAASIPPALATRGG